MESLRHLWSFVYDKEDDKYKPTRIWENPNDPNDYLVMASLTSRQCREQEFDSMAAEANIIVGPGGHCQRDSVALVKDMYSNFAGAMRSNVSADRPAQPVLYLDATGPSLRRGITHCEIGSADFTGTTKQSRATLAPLAQNEGSDKAVPLREHLDICLPSYSRLIRLGELEVDGKVLPMQPITSCDMQGTKALYGMCQSSHSVWCMCGKSGTQQHRYPTQAVTTYDEMLDYFEESVGCVVKSFEVMCSLAHFSPGVARGGAFTPFQCPCCDYKPTERAWKADIRKFQLLSDAEQSSHIAQHNEIGQAEHKWKHHHQIVFTPPLVHLGMEHAGVDGLHLIYLNIFKHLFNYTIHQHLLGKHVPCSASCMSVRT
uniref:Uncharacterized protein n=1 Tax=Chrysotila carterae TaxID=13221 RepID=A0A7S4BZD0_CHRCT